MTKVITRAGWGARAAIPGGNRFGAILGTGTHYEDGPPQADHAKCAAEVRAVQNFHMNVRGWNDIAYNALVCNHDYLYEGRVGGTAANGTNFGNDHFPAVCWLGNPSHTPTDGAKRAIVYARAHLGHLDRPIYPHSHFVPTGCPGNDLRAWIAAGAHSPGKPDPPPTLKHWEVAGTLPDGTRDPASVRWPYGSVEVGEFFIRQQDGHQGDPDTEPDHVWIVTRKGKGAQR